MSTILADVAAEKAILGAMLQTGDANAARALAPTDLYVPAHQHILEAALSLANVGQPVDHLTLAQKLDALGHLKAVGGPAYLMGLDQSAPVVANVSAYVASVRAFAQRRAVVAAGRAAIEAAGDLRVDPSKAALDASAALADVGSAGARELETMENGIGDELDNLQRIASGESEPCLKTGIDVWDDYLGGLMRGRLTTIGAYPSVGKSALKGTMVRNLAANGTKCGLFELEDPRAALARRFLSIGSGVPVRRLASERLSEFHMHAVADAAQSAYRWAGNLIVDDRSGLSVSQVVATARQMVAQRGVKAIFVDHAGELKMDANLGRYDLDVSAAVRALRDVAKDLDVAVVLFAHFHRPKGNTDKEPRNIRPNSAMWKNSGGFEEAARVAVGLWIAEDEPGGVMATVLKQTEGAKDDDFWMPLNPSSALIESTGGRKAKNAKGYDEQGRAA